MPTPFEIHPGENALIKQPLFQLGDDLTWQGPFDLTKSYAVNDVVLGPSGALTSGLLEIGHKYVIFAWGGSPDDFTNVGAATNTNGTVFVATGTTPAHWTAGSILYKLDDYTVAYKCILPATGTPPPDGGATYWTALPAEPAASIQSLLIQLVQNGKSAVSYRYQNVGAQLTAGLLVVGQQYEIVTFNAGDDFANVGAGSNASGIFFTATGTTPTIWTNASVLQQVSYPANALPADGLFIFELLSGDTAALNGLYGLRITIRWLDTDYFASGGQADVLCFPDFLQVTPC